jgi:hypothetical protein
MDMRQLPVVMRTRQQGQENKAVFNQLSAGESNSPSQETTRRFSEATAWRCGN